MEHNGHLVIFEIACAGRKSKLNPEGYVTVYSMLGPRTADLPALREEYAREQKEVSKQPHSWDFCNWLVKQHGFRTTMLAGHMEFTSRKYISFMGRDEEAE